MAINNVRDTKFTVGTVTGQLSNSVTVAQLQSRLDDLDLSSADAVYAEVDRCNDRCSDNEVDVSLKTVRGTGTSAGDARTISLKFYNAGDGSADG